MFGASPFECRALCLPLVLLVEDDDLRARWIVDRFPGIRWERAKTEVAARNKLAAAAFQESEGFAAVFLDYDLRQRGGGGDGVAASLIQYRYGGPVVVHSGNVVGGPQITRYLLDHGLHAVYAPVLDRNSPRVWGSILMNLAR